MIKTNKNAMILAIFAGILLLISGINGTATWSEIKDFVIENNDKKGKTYSLTEKGSKYLQEYKFIIEFSDSFGLN